MTLSPVDPSLFEIDSVVSKISPQENAFRHHIMERICETGEPYEPANEQEEACIADLYQRNILAPADKVSSVYPVSAQKTTKLVHRLHSGKQSWAMCAVDAIGCTWTFDEPVRVEACCEATHTPIVLEVDHDSIKTVSGDPEQLRVLYRDLKQCNTWSSHCCCVMHFFKDQSSLEQWVAEHICTQTCGCSESHSSEQSCGCASEQSCGCSLEQSCGCASEQSCGCSPESTSGHSSEHSPEHSKLYALSLSEAALLAKKLFEE